MKIKTNKLNEPAKKSDKELYGLLTPKISSHLNKQKNRKPAKRAELFLEVT